MISIETTILVNLAKTKKIIRIIEQSYEYKGKSFEKFAKKVIEKSNGRITIQEVGDSLQTANENKDVSKNLINLNLSSHLKERSKTIF